MARVTYLDPHPLPYATVDVPGCDDKQEGVC